MTRALILSLALNGWIICLGCGKTQSGRASRELNEQTVLALISHSAQFTKPEEKDLELLYIPNMVLCNAANGEGQARLIEMGLAEVTKNIDQFGNCRLDLTTEGKAVLSAPEVSKKDETVSFLSPTGFAAIQVVAHRYYMARTQKRFVKVLSISDGGLGFAFVEFTWMPIPANQFMEKGMRRSEAKADQYAKQYQEKSDSDENSDTFKKTGSFVVATETGIGIPTKGSATLYKADKGWVVESLQFRPPVQSLPFRPRR